MASASRFQEFTSETDDFKIYKERLAQHFEDQDQEETSESVSSENLSIRDLNSNKDDLPELTVHNNSDNFESTESRSVSDKSLSPELALGNYQLRSGK